MTAAGFPVTVAREKRLHRREGGAENLLQNPMSGSFGVSRLRQCRGKGEVKSFHFSAFGIMVGGQVTGEHSGAIYPSRDFSRRLRGSGYCGPLVGKIRGLVQGRPLLLGETLSLLFQTDIPCLFELRYHSAWLLLTKTNQVANLGESRGHFVPCAAFLFRQDSAFKRHLFPVVFHRSLHDQRETL